MQASKKEGENITGKPISVGAGPVTPTTFTRTLEGGKRCFTLQWRQVGLPRN